MNSLRKWAESRAQERPELVRVGFFGSYARGDWGVNSDLDLILIVEESRVPFWERALEWDATSLPVPADVLVYTAEEWGAMTAGGERFSRVLQRETVWVYERDRGL